jgi:GR25 family glycosyltransferase involved in LPS biosynthesis
MAMSSGERGCASSHLTLWRHCSDLEARLLVLEGATSGDLG